jgi:hypothetical protein
MEHVPWKRVRSATHFFSDALDDSVGRDADDSTCYRRKISKSWAETWRKITSVPKDSVPMYPAVYRRM